MTVAELITKLQAMPQEELVLIKLNGIRFFEAGDPATTKVVSYRRGEWWVPDEQDTFHRRRDVVFIEVINPR